MTQPGTDPLRDLAEQTRLSDSPFARGMETGHPRRPREYRRGRGPGWALLGLAALLLVFGVLLPQGLMLASGLVVAGMGAYLLAPPVGPHHLDRP
ncbi:DUF3040 domain-containing protein [Streptomyces sp. J2-1]|uniref:DUF3040 domain-containing protein n=1 Tax=Streptomyces corallincola TaxID=2851888 RepID=UPI001C38DF68|nr:DUF3040 domain-containing protein [Streptomyces corallincola]MBV2353825.1 DUF3040 domain-containing protein [Streptomyces corallincola]